MTRSLFLGVIATLALAAPAIAGTQVQDRPLRISAASGNEATAKPSATSEQQASVDESEVTEAAVQAPQRKVRVILGSPYGR